MTIQTSTQLSDKVAALKEQRKNGDIGPKDYYRELLSVLSNLADSLIDELDNINDAEVRSQIPLLLVLLDDQIRAFFDRE